LRVSRSSLEDDLQGVACFKSPAGYSSMKAMKLCIMIGVEIILIITTTEKKLWSHGHRAERGNIVLKVASHCRYRG
jgi:hypothetical protein